MTEERRKEWARHIREAIARDPAPKLRPDLVLAALESFEHEVANREREECALIVENEYSGHDGSRIDLRDALAQAIRKKART